MHYPVAGPASRASPVSKRCRLLSGSRVRQAGGTIQVIALDEPYYFAHQYDGPKRLATGRSIAWPTGVADFVRALRQEWPEVIVGYIEPTPSPIEARDVSWSGSPRTEPPSAEPLASLDLDMDWSRFGWADLALDIEVASRSQGVPIGMIYNGGARQQATRRGDASRFSTSARNTSPMARDPTTSCSNHGWTSPTTRAARALTRRRSPLS